MVKERHPIRFKVFICNIIITVLCLASILAYFILPFWKVDVKLNLNGDLMKAVLTQPGEGEGGGEGGPGAMSFVVPMDGEATDPGSSDDMMMEMLENMDWNLIFGENGIDIPIAIQLNTADILSTNTENAQEKITTLITTNVETVMTNLEEPLNKLSKGIMTGATSIAVETTVNAAVQGVVEGILAGEGGSVSSGELKEETDKTLKELGLDDGYISEKIVELFDELGEEPQPVETVAEEVVDLLMEVQNHIKDNAVNVTNPEIRADLLEMELLDPSEQEDMEAALAEMLVTFADEEGKIDMNNLLASLMSMLEEMPGEGEGGEGATPAKVGLMNSSSGAVTEEDAKNALIEKLRTSIAEMITPETAEAFAVAMQGISYLVYFTFFTWAYLILKILVKARRHNNAIKLKVPILLGSLPYLILGLLPTVAMSVMKSPEFWAEMGGEGMGMVSIVMQSLSITFVQAGVVSFYVGAFLFLFVIFYYGWLRRKLKKEVKAAKKAKKLAKREARKAAKAAKKAA